MRVHAKLGEKTTTHVGIMEIPPNAELLDLNLVGSPDFAGPVDSMVDRAIEVVRIIDVEKKFSPVKYLVSNKGLDCRLLPLSQVKSANVNGSAAFGGASGSARKGATRIKKKPANKRNFICHPE